MTPAGSVAEARRLLVARADVDALRRAVAALHEAGEDGEALNVLAGLVALGAVPQPLTDALDLLQRAAQCGHAPSQAELRLLARREGDDWSALRKTIDIGALSRAPSMRVLSQAPRVGAVGGFATPAECAWLIATGRGGLARAKVYLKAEEAEVASSRTNSEADYSYLTMTVTLRLVRERIAAALGASSKLFEGTKLLHYAPGEAFAPHVDFQMPSTPALAREIAQRGQRVATFLLYLNEDYEGGETEFPRLPLRFRGATGDALLFANVEPSGAPDFRTIHAGLPPTRGEKWLLSQWVRDKPVTV